MIKDKRGAEDETSFGGWPNESSSRPLYKITKNEGVDNITQNKTKSIDFDYNFVVFYGLSKLNNNNILIKIVAKIIIYG